MNSVTRIISIIVGGLILAGLILWVRSDDAPAPVDDTAARITAMKQEGNTDGLAEIAADRDITASRRALDALGFMGVDAVAHIKPSLKDPRAEVRTRAASAIGHAGDPADAKPLAERLDDPREHDDVRAAAAVAIGRMHGYPHLNDLLDAMIDDPSTSVRRAAKNAYREITGFDMPYHSSDSEADRRKQVQMMRGIVPVVQKAYRNMPNLGRREGDRNRRRRQAKPLPSAKAASKPLTTSQ